MGQWDYKALDHKWNNLKRWVDECEREFGYDGVIAVGRMGDMIRKIQEMSDKTDDIILDCLSSKESQTTSSNQ